MELPLNAAYNPRREQVPKKSSISACLSISRLPNVPIQMCSVTQSQKTLSSGVNSHDLPGQGISLASLINISVLGSKVPSL